MGTYQKRKSILIRERKLILALRVASSFWQKESIVLLINDNNSTQVQHRADIYDEGSGYSS